MQIIEENGTNSNSMTESPASKIRLASPVLPILTALSAILVIVDGYRGWVILLLVFGGLWALSYYWAFALFQGLSIKREIRYGWAQVGDQLEERFTLTNQAHLSALWVEVEGQTNMPDYWANQVRSVKQRSQTRWTIRGRCTRRGLYTLGPTTLQTGDPFGIYIVHLYDPAATTLIVTPRVVPLPNIQVAPGGKAGDGAPRVDAPERTVSSASVREYVSGDSMRWVHWPTSARHNELFVRVFEGTPSGDWWIILDMDRSVQIGEGEHATHEHGVILSASLVDKGTRTGRAVGLGTYGEQLIWHRAQMSDAHKWDILRSLALVQPGDVPLAELLEYVRPSLGKNSSLILITPAIKGEWLSSLLAVRRLGVVPTVLLFDTLTFGSTNGPATVLSDLSAQGIAHTVIPQKLLEREVKQPNQERDWVWQGSGSKRFAPLQSKNGMAWRNIR